MNRDEINFAVEKICEYLKIIKYSDSHLIMDIQHSSLLRRLLSGKEKLKYRPPHSYSYPFYQLYDEKVVEIDGVSAVPEEFGYKNAVNIHQYIYRISHKISDDELIIENWNINENPDLYRVKKCEDGSWVMMLENTEE